MVSKQTTENSGTVVSVRGSVVDVPIFVADDIIDQVG